MRGVAARVPVIVRDGDPNVVRAVEMFEPHARRPTTGVIVTDLYDMDLSTFLQRRSGIVTQKVAWEISRQLATGLAHAHKTGVIHRPLHGICEIPTSWMPAASAP